MDFFFVLFFVFCCCCCCCFVMFFLFVCLLCFHLAYGNYYYYCNEPKFPLYPGNYLPTESIAKINDIHYNTIGYWYTGDSTHHRVLTHQVLYPPQSTNTHHRVLAQRRLYPPQSNDTQCIIPTTGYCTHYRIFMILYCTLVFAMGGNEIPPHHPLSFLGKRSEH